ncbi:MAG: VOC family protein, partial [Novosphingobium sp.]|nr:VOC family protein [Novosphingobium sp.]
MSKNFVFTKLNVGDVDRLEKFYCALFGMEVTARVQQGEGEAEMDERILAKPGTRGPQLILIAYPNRPLPAPGETVLGLMVDNLDKSVAQAQELGASVLVPITEVPEHGLRLAFVADPEGHVTELLQPLA